MGKDGKRREKRKTFRAVVPVEFRNSSIFREEDHFLRHVVGASRRLARAPVFHPFAAQPRRPPPVYNSPAMRRSIADKSRAEDRKIQARC